jgi:squalene-hopene/tetraprenyl-beta-curcumene cyclase
MLNFLEFLRNDIRDGLRGTDAARRDRHARWLKARQQADGGFSLSAYVGGWKRKDNTPLETRSDGYATGLIVYVLRQAGVPPEQPQVKRGLDWLRANQQDDGHWLAWSLNKQRDPASDAGHFMGDAATAYAVLALTASK